MFTGLHVVITNEMLNEITLEETGLVLRNIFGDKSRELYWGILTTYFHGG